MPTFGQDFASPRTSLTPYLRPCRRWRARCAPAITTGTGKPFPLSQDQLLLFRNAYAAVSLADDDWLRTLVTDGDNYLDMYAFVSNIRQLAQNDMGIKYLFQEPFDDEQEQHRRLTSNLSSEPDAIVGIFWCQPWERIRRPGSLAATHTSKGATELEVPDSITQQHPLRER